MLDAGQLKEIDALFKNNQYADEVYEKILPYMSVYLETASRLRQLPLGEAKGVTVMLAGGKR
jgi:hypothetical protein